MNRTHPPLSSQLPTSQEYEETLKRHVVDVWFPRSLAKEHGGFMCDFDRRWTPSGAQDKLLEFQARHTLLAAEASRRFPGETELQRAMHHGFSYLRDVMWDADDGGFFHRLDRAGTPLEAQTKHTHGIAYAIQACVETHNTTGESDPLMLAQTAFDWLEDTAHDAEHGGYFGFLSRTGTAILSVDECPWPTEIDTIATPIGAKDLNVMSDLLEALTALYRATSDDRVGKRVVEVARLVGNKMHCQSGAHYYFCEPDWTPIPHVVRIGNALQAAHRFLMLQGLIDTGLPLLSLARRIVAHVLRHGWDEGVGGLFFAVPGAPPLVLENQPLTVRTKVWWVQFEAMKTLLTLRQHDPESAALDKYLVDQWHYLNRCVLDDRHGGSYQVALDSQRWWRRALRRDRDSTQKGTAWKDASHDGRSLLGCLEALDVALALDETA